MNHLPISELRNRFGSALQVNIPLKRYTTARVGGAADALLVADSSIELEEMMRYIWSHNLPYLVLGGGSNVLVSDAGFRGVVVLNRARQVRFELDLEPPLVWVESGANFGSLARQACQRGLGGLEWAIGVPGTIGGAVVGNAGAHGGEISGNLVLAEILHRKESPHSSQAEIIVKEGWSPDRIAFQYRTSIFKQLAGRCIVLAASLKLNRTSPEAAMAKAEEFTQYRRRTQPPGATMGSMFKNPAGDFAGRLIEAVGLKGTRINDSEISRLHANFFVNLGNASARDIYALIDLARRTVSERFGILLELEVELVGDWQLEKAAE